MTHDVTEEIPLVFDCLGEDLVGIVHRPRRSGEIGVLAIVAGGPQYRAGVGRGMVNMARELAGHGVPVMRFDYRGLGDSTGDFLGYDHIAEDIKAAVKAFRAEVPGIKQVVLWGGCDAASGAMIHGWSIPEVSSLVLGNPWVSTTEIRSVVLRKHYLRRLSEVQFWQKLVRFEYNLLDYFRAGVQKVTARFSRRESPTQPTATNGLAGKPTDRMLSGLRRFEGPVLFLMSGQSLVSSEFDELINSDRAWLTVYNRPSCKRIDFPNADQTFSDSDARAGVNKAILDWVSSLNRG